MGKIGDLSYFVLVGADLRTVSKTAGIFPTHPSLSLGFTEKELEISSERWFSGRKCLAEVRGYRKMARLL